MGTLGTGSSGTRFIKTKYPFTDGLIADTTKQEGHKEKLEAEKTFINKILSVEIDG